MDCLIRIIAKKRKYLLVGYAAKTTGDNGHADGDVTWSTRDNTGLALPVGCRDGTSYTLRHVSRLPCRYRSYRLTWLANIGEQLRRICIIL